MLIRKCCCCINLKHGYLSYITICLTGRLAGLFIVYHTANLLSLMKYQESYFLVNQLTILLFDILLGWMLASFMAACLLIVGIIKEHSIMLFPYIVISVVEILGVIISNIIFTYLASIYYLINIPLAVVIQLYALLCLIGLYGKFKENEERTLNIPSIKIV